MGAALRCSSCDNDVSVEGEAWMPAIDYELEQLMKYLFQLHDLNKDGVLGENELIQLNKKTAKLHYGAKVTSEEVATKYKDLFRSCLDPDGKPVPYSTFRNYILSVLDARDRDVEAQKMIVEQLIAEAGAARAAFHMPSLESISDAPFLATISFDEGALLGGLRFDQPRLPRMPSVAEEGPKKMSTLTKHSCLGVDTITVSPMSTAASVKPLLEKDTCASSWPCPTMDFALSSISVSREDGLCSLCANACIEVQRQMVHASSRDPQDARMPRNSAWAQCSNTDQKNATKPLHSV